MPHPASEASSSAHSPRPAPETAARRDGPLQRPRSQCCDRNASKAPLPIRRRRGRAGRAARAQLAKSLVPLRCIVAAEDLPRFVRGCGAGAYGEQRSRRRCASFGRRWPAGSAGGSSCAGEPRTAAQWRRRPGRVAAMAASQKRHATTRKAGLERAFPAGYL